MQFIEGHFFVTEPSAFEPLSRRATIIDVARASGVSYSTVSRVLNGYEFVRETTRSRVLEAAEKLGYVANLQARSLAGGRSHIIGLLVPGLDNGYIGEVVRGIDEECARQNYDIMLYSTHRNRGNESVYVKAITSGLTDGLLLIVPLIPASLIEALPSENFPHVLIDQNNAASNSDVVDATNWQGAYDLTKYLLELGHRHIGFISGTPELSSTTERLNGFRAALTDQGVEYEPDLFIPGNFFETGGYRATSQLLDLPQRPTAIFASNDLSAFGAINAARDRGLRIPDDLSIVGFDDIPLASITYPKLTTVRQPLIQMGRVAVKLLFEQIEDPGRDARRVTLSTQLIVRDSCRPI